MERALGEEGVDTFGEIRRAGEGVADFVHHLAGEGVDWRPVEFQPADVSVDAVVDEGGFAHASALAKRVAVSEAPAHPEP